MSLYRTLNSPPPPASALGEGHNCRSGWGANLGAKSNITIIWWAMHKTGQTTQKGDRAKLSFMAEEELCGGDIVFKQKGAKRLGGRKRTQETPMRRVPGH